MKKEDIDKILQEADSKLGNLTDIQQIAYTSENRKNAGLKTIKNNRKNIDCVKAGKKGGAVTGAKAVKDKIGFFAIPLEERIEKYYSKPREYRRILSKKEMEYIRKVYYPVANQFEKIPKGKKRLKELMDMFGVAKGTIHRIIKDNYKK